MGGSDLIPAPLSFIIHSTILISVLSLLNAVSDGELMLQQSEIHLSHDDGAGRN